MRNILFFTTLIFLISCNNTPNKQPENTKSGHNKNLVTDIQFDEEAHDFGMLTSGEVAAFTFVFRNSGEADLLIENVKVDCNCLKVKFRNDIIKPGEKGRIEVEFDSSGMFGRELKIIEVQANTKEPKHLTIFAEIKNELFDINSKNL
jgi:hypothetical protein